MTCCECKFFRYAESDAEAAQIARTLYTRKFRNDGAGRLWVDVAPEVGPDKFGEPQIVEIKIENIMMANQSARQSLSAGR